MTKIIVKITEIKNVKKVPVPFRLLLTIDAHRAESIVLNELDEVKDRTLTLVVPDTKSVNGALSLIHTPQPSAFRSMFGGTNSSRYCTGYFYVEDTNVLESSTTVVFTIDSDNADQPRDVVLELQVSIKCLQKTNQSKPQSTTTTTTTTTAPTTSTKPNNTVTNATNSTGRIVQPSPQQSEKPVSKSVSCQSFSADSSAQAIQLALAFANELPAKNAHVVSFTEPLRGMVRVWYQFD